MNIVLAGVSDRGSSSIDKILIELTASPDFIEIAATAA
ncbi:MAG: hypothetical protein RL693_834 [Verrucomicrobiota bacterium]|jgi:hypothetical protein